MAVEIVMPRLGWTMEEGTLVEWLKKPGEAVQAGEVLLTVETDKAVNEVESFDAGRLHIPEDAPGPGATVPVGTVLGYLLAEGEEPPASAAAPAPGPKTAAPSAAAGAGSEARGAGAGSASEPPAPEVGPPAPRQPESGAPPDASTPPPPAGSEAASASKAPTSAAGFAASAAGASDPATAGAAPAISPRARRLAQRLGIDWRQIRGTGRTGRITEDDVRAAAADQAEGSGAAE